MRNLNYFALMSAALLTGAVAFTSCSSDDEVAGDGGTSGRAATDVNKHSIKFQYYCPRYLMYDGETDSLLKPAGAG